MLNVAKSRAIVADYQDMLEEFKGLESVSEIPLFSGDHWAASIHNKLKEESKKLVRQASGGSGAGGPSGGGGTPGVVGGGGASGSGGAGGGGAGGKAAKAGSMSDMVDQLTEEMKSMRNHFIVVTLHEQHVGVSSGKCKPPTADGLIADPDGLLSNDLIDSRATFLEKCQVTSSRGSRGRGGLRGPGVAGLLPRSPSAPPSPARLALRPLPCASRPPLRPPLPSALSALCAQVFHWQFNEVRNAQHSTMMLLYYLHNRHRNKPIPAAKRVAPPSGLSEMARIQRSRTHKIESAMRDW